MSRIPLFLLFVLLFTSTVSKSQDLRGLWQGYITAIDNGVPLPNSSYVLDVKQQRGDLISGKAYIFRTKSLEFEGILDFIAVNNRGRVTFRELKILHYKEYSKELGLCVKNMVLDLVQDEGVDYLRGAWDGTLINGRGCPPGKVFLNRYNPKKPEGIAAIPEQVMQKIKQDPGPMRFLQTDLMDPIIINVKNHIVRLQVEDYMREDNDTVSIYFNRDVIAKKLRIRKKPQTFAIRLDKQTSINELIMYAENLGFVPPNTSVLVIDDGL